MICSSRKTTRGAMDGWQQQYDTDIGKALGGLNNGFRRGSSCDKVQDFSTPREMREMRDNRRQMRYPQHLKLSNRQ